MQLVDYSESGGAVFFYYTFGQAHEIIAPRESGALGYDLIGYMLVYRTAAVKQGERVAQSTVGNLGYERGGILV